MVARCSFTRGARVGTWLAALALGCSSADAPSSAAGDDGDPALSGGQTGEESDTLGCVLLSTQELALSETSALGFSASEGLAAWEAPRRGTLTWARGGETKFELDLVASGGARHEDRHYQPDGSGREDEVFCDDRLVVPVQLTFVTDDGAFAETWESELVLLSVESGGLSFEVALGELTGSFALTDAETSGYAEVLAYFQLDRAGSAVQGRIHALGLRTEGEITSGEGISIASF